MNSRFFWTVVAFAINAAGSLAAWGLAYMTSRKDDFPGEAFPVGGFVFGTVWAGAASFLTMRSFAQAFRASSISPILGGLILAFVTLPLSASLNFPASTPNPIMARATTTNVEFLYGICILEYFIVTVGVGAILIFVARVAKFSSTNVVGVIWIALVLLYVFQLPVALAVGGNFH